MNRLHVELGYHYIEGEKRHIHADSEGNVAFRETYLANKLANRVKVQGRYGVSWGVVRPEVFLDESYCNVNHVTGKTWLTSEKVRYGKTGKGSRACMIAAGVIKTRGAVATGEFVEGSIKVWKSALKRKLWDEDDYHGNFDAEQFERWFQNLCCTLKAKYGECNHMDGASSHKRTTNKTPTMSWLKAAMVAWIIDMVGHAFNPKATKAKLMEIVEQHAETSIYAATTIATSHGYLVYFTPPSHPTLQPIELIWGRVKGDIARRPAKNASDLVSRVMAGLEEHGKAWLSVYRHVQGKEDEDVALSAANAE
ncbi:hypothetical protein PF005_g967 [Phytophthora fragariae]|uniref:Tc1-like transposase DDE domain-containing protein n=2 Tax=Phytophthora fragariae TaxID=53985 RepID=A0A6A4AHZ5_9STRA|nr:hypothetical protein PF003_g27091 [Phytophthora fragariae]KAE8941131.1 hypothetical protein PF009_g9079 [Phytophthora fragariae]KAE9029144.1 hypothetical protein PF011_g1207 [Phytophthora fragariae]KAE9137167.1 hypothetical protein PF010_g1432 [Phytophthora fragariae]KAE9154546.1 hypothetical protein PF006_g1423 [Phytophthora fragariae]